MAHLELGTRNLELALLLHPDAIVKSFLRTTTESKYPGFPPAAVALRAGLAGAVPFFACMRVS
jgi:hypothetical protein